MNYVVSEILDMAEGARKDADFLSVLFGSLKEDVIGGKRQVVLFGAGSLGKEFLRALRELAISVAYICDNDPGKIGAEVLGVPVISIEQMCALGNHFLVVIASQKHQSQIYKQLLAAGISENDILCKPSDTDTDYIYSFSMVGSQQCIADFRGVYYPVTLSEVIRRDADRILQCYELLSDQKSKDLLVTKLALMASGGNLDLLKKFITEFSEPYRQFGMFNFEGTTEDYYYFNNDVVCLDDGEIFVDVGAFDGDTIETFVAACDKRGVCYGSIIAFEPDPPCYAKLIESCRNRRNVECHQLGLGEADGVVKFLTSDEAERFSVGIEHVAGKHEVKIVTLDHFLAGRPVTMIKMDPGANIIPKILRGAKETISGCKPKLALGAYHSLEAIYEIPLLAHSFNPGYRMYLRHNTYHLADTDFFAIP